jgi:hypothetical protein
MVLENFPLQFKQLFEIHFSVAHECSQNLLCWFQIEVTWFSREYVEHHKVVDETYFVCCEAHTKDLKESLRAFLGTTYLCIYYLNFVCML